MSAILLSEGQLAFMHSLQSEWASITWPQWTMLDVAVIVWTLAVLAIGRNLIRNWIKRKGFRMIVKDRNQKMHAMWLDIIQDGIDARVLSGELSHKEANAMFQQASFRMGFHDLVPKKRIAPWVKESLKKDKALRAKARAEGTYKEVLPIPGGPPGPVVRTKFSERLGNAAKFLRKAS